MYALRTIVIVTGIIEGKRSAWKTHSVAKTTLVSNVDGSSNTSPVGAVSTS